MQDLGGIQAHYMAAEDFAGFEVLLSEETETVLDEGLFHTGRAAVLRFVARKPLAG